MSVQLFSYHEFFPTAASIPLLFGVPPVLLLATLVLPILASSLLIYRLVHVSLFFTTLESAYGKQRSRTNKAFPSE